MSLNMKLMLVFAVVSSLVGASGVIGLRALMQGYVDIISSLSISGWVASLVLLIAAAVKWTKN